MKISYVIAKGFRKILGRAAIRDCIMGRYSKVDEFSTMVNSTLDDYSYVGANSTVIHTKIGKFCSISNYCAIGGGRHPMDWVSTSPVFNNTKSILKYRIIDTPYNPFVETRIGNDVWIGSHCLIRAGVKIGDGAVVGMGSVVTKDIGAYEVWGGNPAKFIKKRFDDETVRRLLKKEWWNWDLEKIQKYSKSFNNISGFLEETDG